MPLKKEVGPPWHGVYLKEKTPTESGLFLGSTVDNGFYINGILFVF